MSYIDIVICIGPDRILETWSPIYRGQERPVRERLRVSQVDHHVYSRYTPCLTDLYLRVHLIPYSPDPKSFIQDICRINPRQLAPTVGTWGVGIMNLMAFLLLANISSEVDENQKMELTIGSLSFCVGSSGSTRLSDLAKLDPSASKTKTITMSGSSVGSSSEVNFPVSFATAESTIGKIKELNETPEKLDIGGTVDTSYISQKDFITRSGGVSRNIHQLCVIITEAAEENDHADNTTINVQADKSRSNSKKEKEKIHISIGVWRIIMSAISIMVRKYPPIREEKF
jgi:hypothetical protein